MFELFPPALVCARGRLNFVLQAKFSYGGFE